MPKPAHCVVLDEGRELTKPGRGSDPTRSRLACNLGLCGQQGTQDEEMPFGTTHINSSEAGCLLPLWGISVSCQISNSSFKSERLLFSLELINSNVVSLHFISIVSYQKSQWRSVELDLLCSSRAANLLLETESILFILKPANAREASFHSANIGSSDPLRWRS